MYDSDVELFHPWRIFRLAFHEGMTERGGRRRARAKILEELFCKREAGNGNEKSTKSRFPESRRRVELSPMNKKKSTAICERIKILSVNQPTKSPVRIALSQNAIESCVKAAKTSRVQPGPYTPTSTLVDSSRWRFVCRLKEIFRATSIAVLVERR